MFSFGQARPLSVTVVVDVAGIRQGVTRDAVERSRWVTGAHGSLRFGWRAARAFEPFVGGGVESVFGETPVVVGERTVAEIAPVRAALEAGVGFHFF
jgi:hypothetical protein